MTKKKLAKPDEGDDLANLKPVDVVLDKTEYEFLLSVIDGPAVEPTEFTKSVVKDYKESIKSGDLKVIYTGSEASSDRDKMKETKPFESEAAAAIHESVAGLYEIGLVDKQTMRKFDESCLTPEPPPDEGKSDDGI